MSRTLQTCLFLLALAGWSSHAGAADTWADILAPGASVEKLAGGFQFIEGPLWHPDGYLLFSDTPADTIYKWQPGLGISIYRHPAGPPNGQTLDRQGRHLVCETGARVSRTERDGKIVTVADRYQGKRLNSPNDIVVRSDGSIYFTDPTYGMRNPDPNNPDTAPLGFRGVYRVDKAGAVMLLDRGFQQPNGLAFSPDEKRLYVGDSERMDIRAYDVLTDGTLANGRTFAVLKETGKDGAPDGMKVDRRGNLFSSGPGAVWVFAPSGELLGKIPVPEVPANVAFGGPGYQDLFITARTGLYRVRLKNPGIAPGRPNR